MKKYKIGDKTLIFTGAGWGTRTPDLLITNLEIHCFLLI